MGDQSKNQSGDEREGSVFGLMGLRNGPEGSKDVNPLEAASLSGAGVELEPDPKPGNPDVLKDPIEEAVEDTENSLRGYENVTWPKSVTLRQILEPAPLPSPFYPLLSTWVQSAEGDLSNGIRELYDDAILDRDTLHGEFTDRSASFGCSQLLGFVCWRETRDPSDERKEGETSGIINYGWVEGQGVTDFHM
jgi:hypothetical protein